MSEIISPLVYQLGVGAVGGFIVGFAVKKISKLLLVLLGIFIVALIYLGVSGIISINYDALWNALAGGLSFLGQAGSWLIGLVSLIPFMGSFIAGFLLGLKIG
ncbi:MAG: FUN14 domain-containing protein [Candidatus Bathycorpusculaceae bacterium]